eukprot:126018-Pelagomonas_calceolata.AAC.5
MQYIMHTCTLHARLVTCKPAQEASSKPASAAGHHPNSASLRKAFITLLGGRGKLPRPEELDIYAGKLYREALDAGLCMSCVSLSAQATGGTFF